MFPSATSAAGSWAADHAARKRERTANTVNAEIGIVRGFSRFAVNAALQSSWTRCSTGPHASSRLPEAPRLQRGWFVHVAVLGVTPTVCTPERRGKRRCAFFVEVPIASLTLPLFFSDAREQLAGWHQTSCVAVLDFAGRPAFQNS